MYSLTPSLISSKYNSSSFPSRIANPFTVVYPCTGVQSAQAGLLVFCTGLQNRYKTIATEDLGNIFSTLVHRYTNACAHPYTIERLRAAIAETDGGHLARHAQIEQQKFAIVLRYHPVFAKVVHRALGKVPLPDSYPFKNIFSWRNALPSIGSAVECLNKLQAADFMGSRLVAGELFLSTNHSSCNLGSIYHNEKKVFEVLSFKHACQHTCNSMYINT